jgi:uncharacterized membrane protein YfcA
MKELQFLALGLVAGVASGMFGIGGGVIVAPALILLFGFKELHGIGTSLSSLVLPVGLLGVIEHYRAGNVQVKPAILIALGIFLGAFFGAKLIIGMPPGMAKRVYGGFLLLIGSRMLFWGK